MTGVTQSCFEPALDYIVVKMPRWDLKKFALASKKIGSGMKSVGEVMAIGRTFEEALQKAIRMLGVGAPGLVGLHKCFDDDELERNLTEPTPERIFALAAAMKRGLSIERIHQLTHIDEWFLYKIRRILEIAQQLDQDSDPLSSRELLMTAKQAGFSDQQIARLTNADVYRVKERRQQLGIVPCIKQIDTLAAEYPARSKYLYLTYNGDEDDIPPANGDSVIVLGSGAYRIGSSVEFDWCCVSAVQTLRQLNVNTIMINHNPETVSTDFDTSDMLFFASAGGDSIGLGGTFRSAPPAKGR